MDAAAEYVLWAYFAFLGLFLVEHLVVRALDWAWAARKKP